MDHRTGALDTGCLKRHISGKYENKECKENPLLHLSYMKFFFTQLRSALNVFDRDGAVRLV